MVGIKQIINVVGAGKKALDAGQEFKNPAVWKKGQVVTNLLVAILTFVVVILKIFFPDFLISDEDILKIATGIATILTTTNLYITAGSSKKIGLKPKQE